MFPIILRCLDSPLNNYRKQNVKTHKCHMQVDLSLIPNLNVLGSSLGGVVHGEFSYRSNLKV